MNKHLEERILGINILDGFTTGLWDLDGTLEEDPVHNPELKSSQSEELGRASS